MIECDRKLVVKMYGTSTMVIDFKQMYHSTGGFYTVFSTPFSDYQLSVSLGQAFINEMMCRSGRIWGMIRRLGFPA